jgi:alkylation response protein AidB-like acyl-CoA dehydrogenase
MNDVATATNTHATKEKTMSAVAKTVSQGPEGTLLERVAQLADVIRAGGDEAQQLRRAPASTIDALIDAGLFRFAIPRALGGEDASVRETIEVLEAISAIDASIGWNVMLGSEINAMAAGGMAPDLAKEVFIDNPRVVMCGGGGPGSEFGRAVAQPDGGYRVWGRSTFISGCHNSEWCFMPAPIFDGDAPRIVNGAPVVRTFFLNRRDWQIVDTWDMAALRGSGSHDVLAEGAYVPPRFADVELMALPARHENPVFRIPVPLRLAYNKAAIGTGIARGALDAFGELARYKKPLMSAVPMKDKPGVQQIVGECEAMLRAARAFMFEAMEAVEAELRAGRDLPSGPATQHARLACVFAADSSRRVVDELHATAGTSAARMDSPLERKLRDAHGAASHRWVSRPLYADLGRVFLGDPPDAEFAGGSAGPVLGGK